MDTICFIPARYGSTRFPGKPLALIGGKPMVWHVYENAEMTGAFNHIVVLTESPIVVEECRKYKIPALQTSDRHQTATDRAAEAAGLLKAHRYILLFGDEPMLTPGKIRQFLRGAADTASAVQACAPFARQADADKDTTVKYSLSTHNTIVGASRRDFPYATDASAGEERVYKHIGLFACTPQILKIYRETPRSFTEESESIELLRLLEKGVHVKAVKLKTDAMSVDVPSDLDYVRKQMEK
ncbi:MAG: NTP transferase domain-containing protein [Oscillospiraceae bacterium]|jgi:3-deoxy-manno-octulosonate cytidylyltransferase (CMP-KDO synthetase)|nr:NTP transferase domain-containing protein [Oscillospiraceae bacterium]